MRTIKAGEFKAKCLRLMDEVAETGDPLVITKNGRPVAQLAPVKARPADAFGALKKTVTVHGDLIAPLDVEWDSLT